MTTAQTITINNTIYDVSGATRYHYGGFPPPKIDLHTVFEPLTRALELLARYDEKIKGLVNSELLLAPLRQRDAVVSSRMEGTISTLEEVLKLEASASTSSTQGNSPNMALEVALYARALKQAEAQIKQGYDLSELLIKNAHQTLLSHGRGADKQPGEYKRKQNYIGDRRQKRVDFIPISPDQLPQGISELMKYLTSDPEHPLIRTAVSHAEFEALHPFEDGNGRIGRMLIPLVLWKWGIISAPHFFVSDYFEANKDEYISRLRDVSEHSAWSDWCSFFLTGLAVQAETNIDTVTRIQSHYEQMKEAFRNILRSQYFVAAVDYMFARPVFWNNRFVEDAEGPKSTLRNFTPRLVEAGILKVMIHPSGRAPGLYAFPSLLEIIDTEK